MRHRIKQFFKALVARITEEEALFIKNYLSPAEQDLFNKLNTATRKHSVQVARFAWAEAPPTLSDEQLQTIIKAALLHDIGKGLTNLSVLDKSLYVLLKKLAPRFLQRITRQPTNNLFFRNLSRALYTAENHASLGAAMARRCRVEEAVVRLIANHHLEVDTPLPEQHLQKGHHHQEGHHQEGDSLQEEERHLAVLLRKADEHC